MASLRRHGLLTAPAGDNVVRLLPPLIIEQQHIDEALAALDAACRELSADAAALRSGAARSGRLTGSCRVQPWRRLRLGRNGGRRTIMGLNRRSFLLQSLALSAVPVGNAALAQAQAKLEDSLVIRTTGGVFEQALKRNFFDPFSKATGVKVVPVAASYGEMMAKTAAMNAAGRVEWDIISPQYYELEKLSNVLVDLGDCSAMPNVGEGRRDERLRAIRRSLSHRRPGADLEHASL